MEKALPEIHSLYVPSTFIVFIPHSPNSNNNISINSNISNIYRGVVLVGTSGSGSVVLLARANRLAAPHHYHHLLFVATHTPTQF
jgi:hypothetical protein